MAIQMERGREHAVLRAIGLTPGRRGDWSRGESAVIGLVAGVLAIPLGAAQALVLIRFINRRSFGWTMQTFVDPWLLLQAVALALAPPSSPDLPGDPTGPLLPGAGAAGGVSVAPPGLRPGRAVRGRSPRLRPVPVARPGPAPRALVPPASVTALLGGEEPGGFARATAPREFRFPADHGPHPEFRHEWWYFTGNLRAAGGRRFGYQLTFFRFALSPGLPDRRSAVGDDPGVHGPLRGHRRARKPVSTTSSGPGAAPSALRGEPRARSGCGSTTGPRRGRMPPPFRSVCGTAEQGAAVDLLLDTARPIVPQGDRGFRPEGRRPGKRVPLLFDDPARDPRNRPGRRRFVPVEGNSWLDANGEPARSRKGRRGGTGSPCSFGRKGPDVLPAPQEAAGPDPFSAGTLVSRTVPIARFRRRRAIEDLESWRSPESGARYPSRWRLRLPHEGLELEVFPRIADQELRTAVRYWEGAVGARGTSRGERVEGKGTSS